MNDSKGKLLVAVVTLLLFVILVPLFIIALAAEDEHNRKARLTSCAASVNGEQMIVPPEYVDAIRAAATTANLPEGIIAAQLFTESRFDPRAVSPTGARGIAQFIPSSWEVWGNGADPFDPLAGIDAQGRYMAQLQKDIASLAHSDQERIELALAAYNAGPAAVIAAGGIPPIPQTQAYVPQIMSCAQGSHRVRVGQTVAAGTPLCTEGATGYATGPHLHFEVQKDGTSIDPEPLLIANGVPLTYNPGLR